MSNTEKPKVPSEHVDNPEWTKADIEQARPAGEVLVKFIGRNAVKELLKRGKGRPPKEHRKVNQTLRLDQDVLDAYRKKGKGWQTRMNEVLRQNMPKQKSGAAKS